MTANVYYFYDADDWCIYVGCSVNVKSRVAWHSKHAYWREHAAGGRVEIGPAMEHREALALEAKEIARLGPAFNIRDNYAANLARDEWWAGFYDAWERARYLVAGVTYMSYLEAYSRLHLKPGVPPGPDFATETFQAVA